MHTHAVDYFAVLGAILCTARIVASHVIWIRPVARMYGSFVLGLGIGMFARFDGDCKVYIVVGASMLSVEVFLWLCPGCLCALKRLGAAIVAALAPRVPPSKVDRMDQFFGRISDGGARREPFRAPPPPPPRKDR